MLVFNFLEIKKLNNTEPDNDGFTFLYLLADLNSFQSLDEKVDDIDAVCCDEVSHRL